MQTLTQGIRNNLLLGLVAFLPIAAIGYLMFKLFGVLQVVAVPLAPYVSADRYLGTAVIVVAGVLGLAVLLYMVGRLISRRMESFDVVGKQARRIIPGYGIIENILRGMAGDKMAYPPALISLMGPGTATLGFVMEDDDDAYLTVFVPSCPVMTVGAIHVVERSLVSMIDGSSTEAAACITQWGSGLRKFRGTTIPARVL